jgi:hypothetical protein
MEAGFCQKEENLGGGGLLISLEVSLLAGYLLQHICAHAEPLIYSNPLHDFRERGPSLAWVRVRSYKSPFILLYAFTDSPMQLNRGT